MSNICLLSDSYKESQWCQHPPDTIEASSYLESRGGMFDKTVFFGLQSILKRHLIGNVISPEKIELAKRRIDAHMGPGIFNTAGWYKLYEDYDGRLPLTIRAVREGSLVPTSNVLMTITNSDPSAYWLVDFVETILLQVWYPITVATLSHNIKNLILRYLYLTGDPTTIDFKLHDFGFRGTSSRESAAIGGLAHLLSFSGTDTLAALEEAFDYYNETEMPAFSIPASQHSTITSWGRDNESKAYENMLNRFPKGLVAVVSDSYNIYNACEKIWGEELKDKVLEREGTLIIRPDSGRPEEVVLKCLNILADKFGYETNSKGYKVLNPKVRLIQGDGINYDSIKEILETMKTSGYSADNIAFGMGGALLQQVNRDTQKMAIKCSYIRNNKGELTEVYKDPITDSGKQSKKGEITLIKDLSGQYKTVQEGSGYKEIQNELQVVYADGRLVRETSLKECRQRLKEEENSQKLLRV